MTRAHSIRTPFALLAGALWMATIDANSQTASEVMISGRAHNQGDQIVVQIFADAPKTALYSYGVGVAYDSTEVAPVDGTTFEDNWFLGEASAKNPYPGFWLPQNASKALLIGGRLDVENPTQGLSGSGLLLGSLTFSKLGAETPKLVLELARDQESFSNFVSVDGRVLDDEPGALAFGDIEFVSGPVDSDNDGLDDDWERDNFGDLSEGPDGDPDGDQVSTGDEFVAGTDPDDGTSFLQLRVKRAPRGVVLRWESAPGRVYTLESAVSIPGGFKAVAPGLPATPPANELDLSISEETEQLFYRLTVRRLEE